MTLTLKLVFGWGINDADYPITKYAVVNGKRKQIWICPYYEKWRGVIERCFSYRFHEANPTYVGCTVCEEWKYFSNFIKWVDSQPNRDWEICQPDKDLLLEKNKHYSPDTVIFVSSKVNGFILDSKKVRGSHMIGVTYYPNRNSKNPYAAQCMNPFGLYRADGRYLGYFPTELEAHLAWQAKKHEYACQLADLQDDPRVAKALRERYTPDKDWTKL